MLDAPDPSQDGSRRLNGLIKGESIIFSVTVGHDWDVSELKEKIKEQRRLDTLKDVGIVEGECH